MDIDKDNNKITNNITDRIAKINEDIFFKDNNVAKSDLIVFINYLYACINNNSDEQRELCYNYFDRLNKEYSSCNKYSKLVLVIQSTINNQKNICLSNELISLLKTISIKYNVHKYINYDNFNETNNNNINNNNNNNSNINNYLIKEHYHELPSNEHHHEKSIYKINNYNIYNSKFIELNKINLLSTSCLSYIDYKNITDTDIEEANKEILNEMKKFTANDLDQLEKQNSTIIESLDKKHKYSKNLNNINNKLVDITKKSRIKNKKISTSNASFIEFKLCEDEFNDSDIKTEQLSTIEEKILLKSNINKAAISLEKLNIKKDNLNLVKDYGNKLFEDYTDTIENVNNKQLMNELDNLITTNNNINFKRNTNQAIIENKLNEYNIQIKSYFSELYSLTSENKRLRNTIIEHNMKLKKENNLLKNKRIIS